MYPSGRSIDSDDNGPLVHHYPGRGCAHQTFTDTHRERKNTRTENASLHGFTLVCQNTDLFREYTTPEGFSLQTLEKRRATGKRKSS